MPNKFRKPLITESVRKIALWNIVMFLMSYLMFTLFTFLTVGIVLRETYDSRLEHEMIRMKLMVRYENEKFELIDRTELYEPDFKKRTERPLFLQIKEINGDDLLKSDNVENLNIPFLPPLNLAQENIYSNNIPEFRMRSIYSGIYDNSKKLRAIIQISTPDMDYYKIFNRIIFLNVLTIPLMLIIIVLLSVFLAKKSYKNLNRIIDTAENISDKNLKLRIDYKADAQDEFGRLRDTLNSLFDRLELHISQISQFTDNASHQLMTPLTALKSELEFILRKDRDNNEYQTALAVIQVQVNKMIKIIKTLLIIAGAGSETNKDSKSAFDLKTLLHKDIEQKYPKERVFFDIEPNLLIRSLEDIFSMALENLIENALKYSPPDESVSVRAFSKNEMILIEVSDNGYGIEDSEKEKIFERFYRADKIEKLGIKGYGLGLCLVKAIISSIGGKLEVKNNLPQGTKMIISLNAIKIE